MRDLKVTIRRLTISLAPFVAFVMALSATRRWG